ncbi:MAG: ZIP family metal transporter, partial [Achromobacter mucicolens]
IAVAAALRDLLQAGEPGSGLDPRQLAVGAALAGGLLAAGYRRAFAVGFGMASGLVEPLGSVLGAAIVGWSASLLPWGLGFAAGAMLFVISHEIIPETHRKGHEVPATCGLMLGFVLMMLLDTALQ